MAFVEDVKKLKCGDPEGPMKLELKGFQFEGFIDMFILDSPAKCDTLGIKQWTAAFGCPKCRIEGKSVGGV